MLQLATTKKQKVILNAQLADEKNHVLLFQNEIAKIGLDPRADRYSNGYSSLVEKQATFCEKVFTFQILTEAISAGYCVWRIANIDSSNLTNVDKQVAIDEKRHLVMGETLLTLCDPDEVKTYFI